MYTVGCSDLSSRRRSLIDRRRPRCGCANGTGSAGAPDGDEPSYGVQFHPRFARAWCSDPTTVGTTTTTGACASGGGRSSRPELQSGPWLTGPWCSLGHSRVTPQVEVGRFPCGRSVGTLRPVPCIPGVCYCPCAPQILQLCLQNTCICGWLLPLRRLPRCALHSKIVPLR